MSTAKMYTRILVSRNVSYWYMRISIRRGSSTEWLSPTAIFGDLGGYFIGNVRDKASNII